MSRFNFPPTKPFSPTYSNEAWNSVVTSLRKHPSVDVGNEVLKYGLWALSRDPRLAFLVPFLRKALDVDDLPPDLGLVIDIVRKEIQDV